jgi:preprotein translocase subunit SecE
VKEQVRTSGRGYGVKLFKQAKNFLLGVRAELKKVTWTSRNELIESTIVVVAAVLIVAVFLGLVDYLMQTVVLGGRFSLMRFLTK